MNSVTTHQPKSQECRNVDLLPNSQRIGRLWTACAEEVQMTCRAESLQPQAGAGLLRNLAMNWFGGACTCSPGCGTCAESVCG